MLSRGVGVDPGVIVVSTFVDPHLLSRSSVLEGSMRKFLWKGPGWGQIGG